MIPSIENHLGKLFSKILWSFVKCYSSPYLPCSFSESALCNLFSHETSLAYCRSVSVTKIFAYFIKESISMISAFTTCQTILYLMHELYTLYHMTITDPISTLTTNCSCYKEWHTTALMPHRTRTLSLLSVSSTEV